MPNIQFNDDIDIAEISKHSRSLLDDLFYEDNEIAEFRHTAFLIECGLEQEEEEDINSMANPEETLEDIMIQLHSSLPIITVDFADLELKQKQRQQQEKRPRRPRRSKSFSGSVASPTTKTAAETDTVSPQKSPRNRLSRFQDLVNRKLSSPVPANNKKIDKQQQQVDNRKKKRVSPPKRSKSCVGTSGSNYSSSMVVPPPLLSPDVVKKERANEADISPPTPPLSSPSSSSSSHHSAARRRHRKPNRGLSKTASARSLLERLDKDRRSSSSYVG